VTMTADPIAALTAARAALAARRRTTATTPSAQDQVLWHRDTEPGLLRPRFRPHHQRGDPTPRRRRRGRVGSAP
jgi:hypothetical protein